MTCNALAASFLGTDLRVTFPVTGPLGASHVVGLTALPTNESESKV
jgi:hypothetical protein